MDTRGFKKCALKGCLRWALEGYTLCDHHEDISVLSTERARKRKVHFDLVAKKIKARLEDLDNYQDGPPRIPPVGPRRGGGGFRLNPASSTKKQKQDKADSEIESEEEEEEMEEDDVVMEEEEDEEYQVGQQIERVEEVVEEEEEEESAHGSETDEDVVVHMAPLPARSRSGRKRKPVERMKVEKLGGDSKAGEFV